MPTLSKWQSDSSVAMATRKSDPVLSRIDFLVSAFHDAPMSAARGVACDLYYCIDYWLKYVKTNRNMNKGREPAMRALYACTVEFLCSAFHCSVNVLPRELDMMFGRELSELGFKFDFEHGKAEYLEGKEIEKYKIWFKGGRAYQFTRPPEKAARRLLDSSRLHNPEAFVRREGQLPNADYGAFVLTMGRDFYMARHAPGEANQFNGFYHSSYVAGQTVMAAGSMLIRSGRIMRIRSDSGHYKPVDTNMLQVLRALRMVGMPIDDIVVEDFLGNGAVKAPAFWSANGDWNKLKDSRDKNLALRKDLQKYKEERRNPRTGAAEPANNGYEDREAA